MRRLYIWVFNSWPPVSAFPKSLQNNPFALDSRILIFIPGYSEYQETPIKRVLIATSFRSARIQEFHFGHRGGGEQKIAKKGFGGGWRHRANCPPPTPHLLIELFIFRKSGILIIIESREDELVELIALFRWRHRAMSRGKKISTIRVSVVNILCL